MPCRYENGKIIEVKHETVYGKLVEVSALQTYTSRSQRVRMMTHRISERLAAGKPAERG
jgi:hypothetical protein